MYTVLEIADKLNTSKATVYRKLKLIGEEHIKIENKQKYIDDEGFELIKKAIENKNEVKENIKQTNTRIEDKENELSIKHDKYIKNLEEEIDYLREEMQLKNNLLKEQSKQIHNSQLLLLESQRKGTILENDIAADREEDILEAGDTENEDENKKGGPLDFIKRYLVIKLILNTYLL